MRKSAPAMRKRRVRFRVSGPRPGACHLFALWMILKGRAGGIVWYWPYHFVVLTRRGRAVHFRTDHSQERWAPWYYGGVVEILRRLPGQWAARLRWSNRTKPVRRADMSRFDDMVRDEVTRARVKHPPINSLHEGYAVILEEMDEFKAEVWKRREQRDRRRMLEELVQVAAMCQRTAEDLGLTMEVK